MVSPRHPSGHGHQDQPALFDVPAPRTEPAGDPGTEPSQDALFEVPVPQPADAGTGPAPEVPSEPLGDRETGPDEGPGTQQHADAEPQAASASGPWTEAPRACFDLETTGRDPHTARIVTASVVLVDARGVVTQEWEWLADPGVEIPEEAAAIHGVDTDTARADGLPAEHVVRELSEVLSRLWDRGVPVLAFNAAYDLTVLAREAERHGVPACTPLPVLDPFVLNKQVHRFRRGKRTLGALCEEYGVVLDNAHTSAADALATERLAVLMAGKFPVLQQPAVQLHEAQIGWAAEQAASLQEYFRRRNPHAVVDGTWPVHPLQVPDQQ